MVSGLICWPGIEPMPTVWSENVIPLSHRRRIVKNKIKEIAKIAIKKEELVGSKISSYFFIQNVYFIMKIFHGKSS